MMTGEDMGVPRHRARAALVIGVVLLGVFLAAADPAPGENGGPPPGWKEEAVGWLASLPERRFEARDNVLSAALSLSPGDGLVLTRGVPPTQEGTLALAMSCTGGNGSSRDYRPGEAAFPLAVTAVFGEDSLKRTLGRKVLSFLRHPWGGWSGRGIRLTYAWGNRAPVGSMYRLTEEETVFILAGPDEAGRTISAKRDLRRDFRAAYGRDPRGPVTILVVRAERPSREKDPIRGELTLDFPAR